MRFLTAIAAMSLFTVSATTAVQADGHGGTKCVPYGCYDR